MTFALAMNEVARGEKIRRSSWADTRNHVLFTGGYLSIHQTDGTEVALLVTEGDLFSDDWVVIRESVRASTTHFTRKMGFEPGSHGRKERIDDVPSDVWRSEFPNIDPIQFTSATSWTMGLWPDSVTHLTLTGTTTRAALIGGAKNDPVQIAAKATTLLQDMFDVRQPLSGLPVDDPDKTINPKRPDLFWDGTNLVGRAIVVRVEWDGSRFNLTLSRTK
jgi:hypothetical protein